VVQDFGKFVFVWDEAWDRRDGRGLQRSARRQGNLL